MIRIRSLLPTIFVVLCLADGGLRGAEYYVAPDGKDDAAGTKEAPWSLARANQEVKPGDTVLLLDGTYKGQIDPKRGGTPENRIVYKAANARKAVFEKVQVPINLSGVGYITVDGVAARDNHRWLVAENVRHITVNNCLFENGKGWQNCRFINPKEGIRFTNNHMTGGTDILSIEGSRHLIEGNFFGDAEHTGLVFLAVKNSVVRNNRFLNRRWRCMEVESSREGHMDWVDGQEVFRSRQSEYNLIEGNVFEYAAASAVQYAGNRSIIRRNVFRRCRDGFNWANYRGKANNPEAWHNRSNRFYNNVIADCGANGKHDAMAAAYEKEGAKVAEHLSENGSAMQFATNLEKPDYGDNIVLNNIFFRNTLKGGRSDKLGPLHAPGATICFDWDADPQYGRIFHNNIFSTKPGEEVFFYMDAPYAIKPPEPRNRTIESFQKRYPEFAADNMEVEPMFVDPDGGDFRLKAGSPCVDAGVPLTRTSEAGKGAAIPVEDPLYFTDGYGLVEPDTIRVGDAKVKIVKVNCKAKTVTVDKEIAWDKGAPVSLDYAGKAPDLGAFESDGK